MRLTTKGRYAASVMCSLARIYPEGSLSVAQISKQLELPTNYLAQLFSKLRKAGLVASIRGKNGGFYLGRPPETITVYDIIQVAEEEIAPVHCKKDGVPEDFDCFPDCPLKYLWEDVNKSVSEILQSANLKSVLEICRKRN